MWVVPKSQNVDLSIIMEEYIQINSRKFSLNLQLDQKVLVIFLSVEVNISDFKIWKHLYDFSLKSATSNKRLRNKEIMKNHKKSMKKLT